MVFRQIPRNCRLLTAILSSLLIAVTLVRPLVSQQERTVLRIDNYSVIVDVVVTDKKNRHVTDLSREDFLVFEDGVLQKIDALSYVSVDVVKPSQPTPDLNETSTEAVGTVSSPAPRPNLIVMLLDYATIRYLNQNFVRDAAVRYVNERLGPQDWMAVFRVGRSLRFVQGFTNDAVQLVSSLQDMSTAGSAFEADQSNLVASMESAEDFVEQLASSINALSRASGFGPGAAQAIAILNNQMEKIEMIEGTYAASLSFSREMQARPVIGAIRTIADAVQHLEGRKTLILLSQGFVVPGSLEGPLMRAVDHANRANLAVYAINGEGLGIRGHPQEPPLENLSADREGDRVKAYGGLSVFDKAKEAGPQQEEAVLRYVTKATGGLYVSNTNDLFGALKRVDSDARQHYLLSYRPSNLDFSGEFRSIRVEVKDKKYLIRARPGYWAVPPGASLLSADEFRYLVQAQENVQSLDDPQLPFFASTNHILDGASDYSVRLTLELPTDTLTLGEYGDRRVAFLELTGIVQDGAGETVSSFRGPSAVILDQDQLHEGNYLRIGNDIRLGAGNYVITVRAFEPPTGRLSFRRQSLRLPQPDEKGRALSSLILSEAIGPAETGLDSGEADDIEIFPSARRKFSNGDSFVYSFNVYGPRIDQQELSLEVTVLYQGREVSTSNQDLSGEGFRPFPIPHLRVASTMGLRGLESGKYIIRATVSDADGAVQTTQTSFEIENK
jgi:VWFA-related protein